MFSSDEDESDYDFEKCDYNFEKEIRKQVELENRRLKMRMEELELSFESQSLRTSLANIHRPGTSKSLSSVLGNEVNELSLAEQEPINLPAVSSLPILINNFNEPNRKPRPTLMIVYSLNKIYQ